MGQTLSNTHLNPLNTPIIPKKFVVKLLTFMTAIELFKIVDNLGNKHKYIV